MLILIVLIPAAGQEAPSEPETKKRAGKEQAESQATKEVTREVTVNEGLGEAGEKALRQDLEQAEQAAADAEAEKEELESRISDLQAQIDELDASRGQAQPQPQAAVQQQPSGTGTKHVRVVVSSNIPADVLIWDDNFDADISEEITGRQAYEFDIAKNSGLLAEASNLDQTGNIYVGVYENGRLVAEDRDPQYVQISY